MGKYTHVANSPFGWGKGDHDDEAFLNMIGAARIDADRVSGDTFEFTIVTARGEAHVEQSLHSAGVVADEVVSVTHFEMPVDTLQEIYDLQYDLEIDTEAALVDAATERERPEAEA